MKLLIIADDFTGALDTGIQFVKKGIETQVLIGTQLDGLSISKTAQVLVVDSETRPMTKEDAYTAVAGIVTQAVSLGVEVIYKKTDSALRGNVGSELSAVLDAAGGEKMGHRLYFIPAFPDVRRVTEKGIHYIDGVKLEESGFGRDPFDPMDCSFVPEILGRQTDHKIVLVERKRPIPDCCSKEDQKQQEFSKTQESEILVFDASSNEDILERIAQIRQQKGSQQQEEIQHQEEIQQQEEPLQYGGLRLLAGCAGFAAFLPEALGLSGNTQGAVFKTDYFYVACGSLNPITRKQIEYAAQSGFCRRTLLPQQKLCPDYYDTAEGRTFLQELSSLCRQYKRVEADTFDLPGRETTAEYARKNAIDSEAIRFSISACHGKIVRYLVEQNLELTILMTGGDTLMGFMREIGVNQIFPVAEVGQGAVLSRLYWQGRVLQVISKSGGFGEEDVLVSIARKVMK